MDPDEVFLSYSSKDAHVARRLKAALVDCGCHIWMAPDDISGAESWVDQILAALSRATATIVLISEHSMSSQHVAREVSIAIDGNKSVVPVRITSAPLTGSLNYLLHLSQWIDASAGNIEDSADRIVARLDRAGDYVAASPASRPATKSLRRRLLLAVIFAFGAGAAIIGLVLANSGGGDSPRSAGTDHTSTGPAGSRTTAGGTRSPATTSVDSAISGVPARLTALRELGPYLARIANAEHVPAGTPVSLSVGGMASGSIEVSAPNYWRSGFAGKYLNDASKPVGDIVDVDVNDSRFDRFTASGVGIAVATPPRTDEHSVDTAYAPSNFINDRCVDSGLVSITSPFAGHVRVWGDCNSFGVIAVGYFRYLNTSIDITLVVDTRSEAAAAASILASIQVDPTLVTRYHHTTTGGDKVEK